MLWSFSSRWLAAEKIDKWLGAAASTKSVELPHSLSPLVGKSLSCHLFTSQDKHKFVHNIGRGKGKGGVTPSSLYISTLGIVVTKMKGHGWAATFPALSFLATLQTQQRFAAVLVVQAWQGQVVLGSSAKCRIPQKFHLLCRILAYLFTRQTAPLWTRGRVKSLSQISVIGRC